MASHRCSKCGKLGHKRPTCPGIGIVSSGVSGIPAGRVVSPAEFKADDVVVIRPGTRFEESLVWGKLDDGSLRQYKVESVLSDGRSISCQALNGDTSARPVFDKADLVLYTAAKPAAKRKKINTWDAIEAVVPNSRIVLLFGPPGTGKTTVGNYAGKPDKVINITLTEETPMAEIRGHFIPKGDEFVWMDGPAMTAYRNGYRLVLNEIDKASGDCMTFCHALLDDPDISEITLPNGDCVKPGETFSVVATTNAEPDDLPDALRDRFRVAMFVPRPHPDAIASLPEDLQTAAENSFNGEQPITFRSWKSFAALRDKVGEDVAALAVFGDRAQAILDTLKLSTVSLFSAPEKADLSFHGKVGDRVQVVAKMWLDNDGNERGYPEDHWQIGQTGIVRDVYDSGFGEGWENVELEDSYGDYIGVFYSPNVEVF